MYYKILDTEMTRKFAEESINDICELVRVFNAKDSNSIYMLDTCSGKLLFKKDEIEEIKTWDFPTFQNMN